MEQDFWQEGYESGYKSGAWDVTERNAADTRTADYEAGFQAGLIVHDDNDYDRGFQDGYDTGFPRGYQEGTEDVLEVAQAFQPGDLVEWAGDPDDTQDVFVVVAPEVDELLTDRYFDQVEFGDIHVIGLHDGQSYSAAPEKFRLSEFS